jgi:hypothetical protein
VAERSEKECDVGWRCRQFLGLKPAFLPWLNEEGGWVFARLEPLSLAAVIWSIPAQPRILPYGTAGGG